MELLGKMRGVLAANGITTQKEQNLFLGAFRRRTLIGGAEAGGPIESAWIGLAYGRLGKKVAWNSLPEDCKRLVTDTYKDIWDLT